MYKTKANINPKFMNEIFGFHEASYNLRNEQFLSKVPNTVLYGTETVTYRCGQIWNNIPVEIRMVNSVEMFKKQIKQISIPCLCKLCTPYIQNLGYI